VHPSARSELKLLALLLRHLRPELLAVVELELDPRLEAEVDDALHAGWPRRAVARELEVVRADPTDGVNR
jgi:hypothetical protein